MSRSHWRREGDGFSSLPACSLFHLRVYSSSYLAPRLCVPSTFLRKEWHHCLQQTHSVSAFGVTLVWATHARSCGCAVLLLCGLSVKVRDPLGLSGASRLVRITRLGSRKPESSPGQLQGVSLGLTQGVSQMPPRWFPLEGAGALPTEMGRVWAVRKAG